MEALGTIGMTFGILGMIFGMGAQARVRELEQKLRDAGILKEAE